MLLSSLLSSPPSIFIILSLYRQYLVFTYHSLFSALSQNLLSLLYSLVTSIFSLCSFSVTQNVQSFTAVFSVRAQPHQCVKQQHFTILSVHFNRIAGTNGLAGGDKVIQRRYFTKSSTLVNLDMEVHTITNNQLH